MDKSFVQFIDESVNFEVEYKLKKTGGKVTTHKIKKGSMKAATKSAQDHANRLGAELAGDPKLVRKVRT